MKKIEIKVDGMMCEHCALTVKNALVALGNVEEVKVNLKKKTVKVKCDDSIDENKIKSAITNAGYTPL